MPNRGTATIRRAGLAGGLAAALAALVLLAGCGVGEKPDTSQGKQLFVQNCGSCHTLADAGTQGNVGPNFDKAFQESLANGLGRSTIEGVVREQIRVPQGPAMPANILKGKQAERVAAYVAQAVRQ